MKPNLGPEHKNYHQQEQVSNGKSSYHPPHTNYSGQPSNINNYYQPNQQSSAPSHFNYSSASNPVNGVSYSFHPQMQMNSSPNLQQHYNPNISNDLLQHPQQQIFPTASMSVNLSMNMTMGFTTTENTQLQWSGNGYQNNYPNQAAPPTNNYQCRPYSSPSPPSYTITAEIRPSELVTLPPIEKEFPGVCAMKQSHGKKSMQKL